MAKRKNKRKKERGKKKRVGVWWCIREMMYGIRGLRARDQYLRL
jgi:hypothetical protein